MDVFADIASIILLFAGVGISLLGIWGTWKEWAPEGRSFWSFITHFVETFKRHALRVLGWKKPTHATGTATAELRITGVARGRKVLGPLPSPHDLDEFATAVKQQIDDVLATSQAYNEQRVETDDRQDKEIRALRSDVGQLSLTADAKLRQAMTDGLHLELLGVSLIVISGVVQILKLIF